MKLSCCHDYHLSISHEIKCLLNYIMKLFIKSDCFIYITFGFIRLYGNLVTGLKHSCKTFMHCVVIVYSVQHGCDYPLHSSRIKLSGGVHDTFSKAAVLSRSNRISSTHNNSVISKLLISWLVLTIVVVQQTGK